MAMDKSNTSVSGGHAGGDWTGAQRAAISFGLAAVAVSLVLAISIAVGASRVSEVLLFIFLVVVAIAVYTAGKLTTFLHPSDKVRLAITFALIVVGVHAVIISYAIASWF